VVGGRVLGSDLVMRCSRLVCGKNGRALPRQAKRAVTSLKKNFSRAKIQFGETEEVKRAHRALDD